MTFSAAPVPSRLGALAVVLVVGLGGCGGSPASPAKAGGVEVVRVHPGAGPSTSTAEPPSTAGGHPPTAIGVADKDFSQAEIQLSTAGDCASMCKALASMRKAAEHLCALTKDGGDDDKKRCDGAQEKLKTAEVKVKNSCGGCGP